MQFPSNARLRALLLCGAIALANGASAQTRSSAAETRAAHLTSTTQAEDADEGVSVRGFGLVGVNFFSAADSFDAVLGSRSGAIFGGGVQVTFPVGLYAEVAAWRFTADGERVFVGPDEQVFPLGIATEITVVPIELTAGWRFTNVSRHVVPYAGAGVNWYRYEEHGDFAETGEDVDERTTGFHLTGGVEGRLTRWLRVAGEATWASVPDALQGGVAAALGEDNLGGTSIRLKVLVGR